MIKNYNYAIYWVFEKMIVRGRLKLGGTNRRGNYFLQIFLSASEPSAVMVEIH